MAAARVLVVIGTRPEAIKLAPVVRALAAAPWADVRVVATAQHRELLDPVLRFFEVGVDHDLDAMRTDQPIAELASRMVTSLDRVIADERPAVMVAQGDTTTTLVAALAAFWRRVPFAHVEAGLRTGDLARPFPEEGHRRMVAQVTALHFAPTESAKQNLLREGTAAANVHVVGNTVVDAVQWVAPRVDASRFAPPAGKRLVFVTMHRRESFGEPLANVCSALRRIADRGDVDLLVAVHPNPSVRDVVRGALGDHAAIRLAAPLDYPDAIAAMRASSLILTDSGGIQEEAPSLGKPVLVLRDVTERREAVDAGAALLVGTATERIVAAADRLLDDAVAYAAMAVARFPFGSGNSAAAIVRILENGIS
ncbi:MAG: UDP-N-acetylglucosamine 2-epimerase (non-hydrolyzing) [Planctomycetes bacterium]|nr:UDP-N-acetylglucosamine 2-epimerase (non-hydrolyzing) [Planctomycetota bacterium]